MKTSDFALELKAIDERLEIVPNKNRGPDEVNKQGLSNIKLDGRDVCPVPADEIKEEADSNYYYEFPNGYRGRHKSRKEALAQVQTLLEFIKTEDGKDIFFNGNA